MRIIRLLEATRFGAGPVNSPGSRLRWARENAGYATATDAARAFNWPVSTYLGHENGDRIPSRDKAKRYAQAFKVRWEWILEGEGSPRTDAPATIPVVGYVGAGSEINPVDDHMQGSGLDETEAPPGTPISAVSVLVRGDSMYPRYFDGERLFYVRDDRPTEDLIGRECVVQLTDGRLFVKILRRGTRPHHFHLESWNAPIMEDQAVEWAAPVKWRG